MSVFHEVFPRNTQLLDLYNNALELIFKKCSLRELIILMKTCKRLNIKTVAIYSEADKYAPFVNYADEKIFIGPSPSNKSYLNQDLIIEKALQIEVDAIHPGYGFLSENASFAKKVIKSGIIFIGPSPEAIELMGGHLGSLSQHLVNDYKPLVENIRKLIESIGGNK